MPHHLQRFTIIIIINNNINAFSFITVNQL